MPRLTAALPAGPSRTGRAGGRPASTNEGKDHEMRQTSAYRSVETEAERIARQAIEAERKRRAEKGAERILRWIASAIGVFVSGWLFMLAVGVARDNWLPDLPTIDYGTSTLLITLLYCAALFQTLGRAVAKDLRGGRTTGYRMTAQNTGAATSTAGGTANSGIIHR